MDHPKRGAHGGRRNGSGRKAGGRNALPKGFIPAVEAMKHRAPEDPAKAEVAARAFSRLVDVMEERVPSFQANAVLKAATLVREELCGPIAQKLEHSGADGSALNIVVRTYGPKEDDGGLPDEKPAAVD